MTAVSLLFKQLEVVSIMKDQKILGSVYLNGSSVLAACFHSEQCFCLLNFLPCFPRSIFWITLLLWSHAALQTGTPLFSERWLHFTVSPCPWSKSVFLINGAASAEGFCSSFCCYSLLCGRKHHKARFALPCLRLLFCSPARICWLSVLLWNEEKKKKKGSGNTALEKIGAKSLCPGRLFLTLI